LVTDFTATTVIGGWQDTRRVMTRDTFQATTSSKMMPG